MHSAAIMKPAGSSIAGSGISNDQLSRVLLPLTNKSVHNMIRLTTSAFILTLLLGCNADKEETPVTPPADAAADTAASAGPSGYGSAEVTRNPERVALFGDLHVHTMYSFDAYVFGTRASPDDAYAFAKGDTIKHASGMEMQIRRPLDFEAVTDHGTYLGMLPAMFDPESTVFAHPMAERIREAAKTRDRSAFLAMLPYIAGNVEKDDLLDKNIVRDTWREIAESANRNNAPGKFTTFIGYEYTASGPEFENMHRNVIFKGSDWPELPFTRLDSDNPENLWDWMDSQRDSGRELLAIPHNSNGSNGWMFTKTNMVGDPIDAAYAEQRMRNEPLVEVTQVKGTSDTHPMLSPNDEWADFEIMPVRVGNPLPSQAPGSYVREAYLNGLLMEQEKGINPYRFGLIGSSDTHNAAGSFDEDNYWSKTGDLDIKPEQRGSVPLKTPAADGSMYATNANRYWGASGMAGVWAESNTRDDVYAALRRKETFATTGSFIQVRFFAGHSLPADMVTRSDAVAAGYANGVPMGSDVLGGAESEPTFYAWASRDAGTRPLQRMQIIKGWVKDGETREKVFDVACAKGTVDPATGRCPDNGATVDLATCATNDETGVAELKAHWTDPEFDPTERAFYYVRVLENPQCRWSTWDAIRAGVPRREDLHATLQERAWSSPIWYAPVKKQG